ncbi:hypothetical protein EDD64_10799 [Effusibacillus lacus]|nr:hypothetical protein EDD64_10799 [Effusibacillus lacus]
MEIQEIVSWSGQYGYAAFSYTTGFVCTQV